MDVAFVIRQRLAALGCEQRDLARAAAVTESYISQLLTRKKAPPAPAGRARLDSPQMPTRRSNTRGSSSGEEKNHASTYT
jgi:hypothetical protein